MSEDLVDVCPAGSGFLELFHNGGPVVVVCREDAAEVLVVQGSGEVGALDVNFCLFT